MRSSADELQTGSQTDDQLLTPSDVDMSDVRGIVIRGLPVLVVCSLIGLICAGVFAVLKKPTYKASTRIVLDRTVIDYMRSNKLVVGPALESIGALAQSRVIASEVIALPVVRTLNLAQDPEFVGSGSDSSVRYYLQGLLSSLAEQVGIDFETAEPIDVQIDPERLAVRAVLSRFSAYVHRGNNVLEVSFESKYPDKAVSIVNAFADHYIASKTELSVRSTRIAGELLQDRLKSLRQQVQESEHALLSFKLANNLLGQDSSTAESTRLTTLREELVAARIAMAKAQAQLDGLKTAASGKDNSFAYSPYDSEVITKLRSRYMELSAAASDLTSRVGTKHLAVARLSRQQREIESAIESEQERIKENFKLDLQVAKSRFNKLEEEIRSSAKKDTARSAVLTRLVELRREVKTYRDLYNDLLKRASESRVASSQPTSFASSGSRIVTRASIPTRTGSSGKKLAIVAAGSLLGLLLGGAIVFAREFPIGYFRTSRQVIRSLGMRCVVLPMVPKHSLLSRQPRTNPEVYSLAHPFSRFTETVRSVWASVRERQIDDPTQKVFCVVSSSPKEGKSTVAVNVASHAGVRSDARVLLIDGDFHKQTLTKLLAPNAKSGLREAIERPEALKEVIFKNEELGFEFLPSSTSRRIQNAAELLGSDKMKTLLLEVRERYDLILLEAPPISCVNDLNMIESSIDGFVLIIEWGATSQRMVIESFTQLPALLERGVCAILNKANPSALKSIEAYKGRRYGDYYHV